MRGRHEGEHEAGERQVPESPTWVLLSTVKDGFLVTARSQDDAE